MKRNITLGTFITSPLLGFAFGACILLLLLAACVNHIAEEEEALSGECHEVRITTRAGGENLPYPVSVYAFAPDGACVAQQTVTKATDALKLSLPSGTYHLVALAGTDDYTLPEPMTFTSAITLKAGKTAASSALMMGSADITLATTGTTADITLSYRVARISLALSDVPAGTTAVSVNFSPFHTALLANGSYDGANQTGTVICSKSTATNGWKADDCYLFPGSAQQTVISITLTDADKKTNTYGYTCPNPLLAATPYTLFGSYQHGLGVNGELKYEGWKQPVDVTFSFGTDSGNGDSSNEGGGNTGGGDTDFTVDEIPAAATRWQGHVVALVQNKTATAADLLLISLEEWTGVNSALNADQATQAVVIAGNYTENRLAENGLVSQWRIPTTAEANLLRNSYGASAGLSLINNEITQANGTALSATDKDATGNTVRYLCNDAKSSFTLNGIANSTSGAGDARTYYLRLVRTVPVVKQ